MGCNLQVAQHNRAAANRALRTDDGTSGDASAARNGGVTPNAHVVPHLYQVVQLYAIFYHRVLQSTAVNTGVGTNFHIIANRHRTQLLNFFPAVAIRCKAESIRTYDHSRMQKATLAYRAIFAHRDPGS